MDRDPLTRLRWAMLPVLAAGLFVAFYEGSYRLARWALNGGFATAGANVYFSGQTLVALMVALLAGYPLARLYGRQATAAGAIVGVAIAAYFIAQFTFDEPSMLVVALAPVELCLLMPLFAGLAWRSLRDGPQLAWRTGGGATAGEPSPIKLMWALLPLLALGFFMLHDIIQYLVMELAFLPSNGDVERAAMLLASPVGPALAALPVAYAAACLYGRRAAWMGGLIALPTVWKWAAYYLSFSPLPFNRIVYGLEVLGLASFLPLLAWWLRRRLDDGRLVLAPPNPAAID